jgi:rhodanese-related sulfurtransferase
MQHRKPKEAHDFLRQNPEAVLVDCRGEMEYLFVGHPAGAHHVAWNDGPDWTINPHFVGRVQKIASLNRPVVLICRSGQCSVDAGISLENSGFSDVINGGFEGPLDEQHQRTKISDWRFHGLPWEQC